MSEPKPDSKPFVISKQLVLGGMAKGQGQPGGGGDRRGVDPGVRGEPCGEPPQAFERYADDAILHCKDKAQAQLVLEAIVERLAQVGLELNLDKTRIVYCKDSNRSGSHEHERFDFLGYAFRPRLARSRAGAKFVSFIPAVSDDAAKAIRHRVKRWRLHLWSDQDGADLADEINPTARGWINYRKTQINERQREAARLHKILEDAGIKLGCVATDIMGKSGRDMLDALVAGTTDPVVLADRAGGCATRSSRCARRWWGASTQSTR